MEPVSKSHRKTNVLISFVFADSEYMLPIDQAKNSGSIRFNGQDIPTVPVSSYVRALEITNILKEWILKGEFLLTEPQVMLPTIKRN